MLVLCSNCHNHYDDTCQQKECRGPGNRGHLATGITQPVVEHIEFTRVARRSIAQEAQKPAKGRRSGKDGTR